ncbi:MAG: D-alanyl-D-alanine carboxypeptidase [Erysipelotrichaceae bacterium]|nr:D-alanyl-D-alanine carboxypeptidase [Erysipelotrichaceae bacterium]
MKKILTVLLIICLTFSSAIVLNADEKKTLNLNAEAVILMDAVSGAVLYQKNALLKLEPASITKIMTVYLALTKGDLNQSVVVSDSAIDSIDRSSSHIALDYDEEVGILDMCYAALLASANDAANVLAEHVSGSQEAFVKLMNETAVGMGAQDTHFVNAHGLPTDDENNQHLTTAYDMALMMKTIMKNDQFVEIAKTTSYTMSPTNKQPENRVFANGNEMIKKSSYRYDGMIAGKTGWTEDAGYTYVAAAERDGMQLIVVILNDDSIDDRYKDAKTLFDYGFEHYKQVLVRASELKPEEVQVKKGNQVAADVTFSFDNDFHVLLSKDIDESALTTEVIIENQDDAEKISAKLILYLSDVPIAEVPMEKKTTLYDLSFAATKLPILLKALDIFSVAVMAFFMSLVGYSAYLSNKKKKLRKRKS